MTFQNYLPSDGAVGDGQVLCWASNELGEQSVPCVFYVVPLATPHPPTDCEVGQRIIAIKKNIFVEEVQLKPLNLGLAWNKRNRKAM